jgi:DNA ligase 1
MSQVKQTYDTIIAMRNTASKNDKIALLTKIKANDFAKEYLRMMYEPRVNFYMKKIDPMLSVGGRAAVQFDMETLTSLKEWLCTRKESGSRARIMMATIHTAYHNDYERELLELLIGRDAKSGFGASTINKVWKDLITDVPYMRCCLPKDAKLDKFPWKIGVYSQLKCDGMFANVTHTADGNVTIASRSGSPFPLDMFVDVVGAVKTNVDPGFQMHGELLMYKDGALLPRQLGNGMFNSIQQGGELEPGCVPVYVAWDIIPENQAKAKNKYRVSYASRFAQLSKEILHSAGSGANAPLQLVTTKVVYSMAEANAHYKEMLEAGFEGTIIKNPEMIWEDTTSKHQVKMKLEAECDLRITGFRPGKGKNEALFGSIIGETSDGLLECAVSGMPDKMRAQIWADRALIVGKIMTVKSNCLMTPSKDGGLYSLFLPRLEEVRLDKKTADTLQRVKDQFEAAIQSVA